MEIPLSTYRLQFTPQFTFSDAEKIVPYLRGLGMDAVYASPIFQARPGSQHGYDVVDPNRINDELGGEKGFLRLRKRVRKEGLAWLQDVVPNHMAFDPRNGMLMDVLEKGRHSRYVRYFDINWSHQDAGFKGKVLAPFLGKFYPNAIEDGDIRLDYDRQGLCIRYYEWRLPLYLCTYARVLRVEAEKDPLPANLRRMVTSWLEKLDRWCATENRDEAEVGIAAMKERLWELTRSYPEIRGFIRKQVAHYNGTRGKAESFDPIDTLLAKQIFRLTFWKVATEQINYRRFFNINELISLNIGNPRVFEDTHALILDYVRQGHFDGLRIDHIDGLYDPTAYLGSLRRHAPETYLVVEKILDLDEVLPFQWPVQGTTGYEFMNYVNGVFVDMSRRRIFDRIYRRFTKVEGTALKLMHEKKRLILGKHMAGDIENLAHLFKKVSDRLRYGHDLTFYGLKRALVEVMVFFPVYRTYIDPSHLTVMDRMYIREAVEQARESLPGLTFEINFIEKFLLLEFEPHYSVKDKKAWFHFVMRFQQYTGPLMAKGFEDTALYIYNRLVSLNEVGGDPDRFGISPDSFHRFMQDRMEKWPHTMNATSTHDTKRGEDVRARIDALSEIPGEWEQFLMKAKNLNRTMKPRLHGERIPTSNDEYFLYQTLIGTWESPPGPADEYRQRIKDYVIKAVREAKVHTAWLKPDEVYEQAFLDFIDRILDPEHEFLSLLTEFTGVLAPYGYWNSLAQTALKMTAGGVADFYQGTELWQLTLVDPDNRRDVDYGQRSRWLEDISLRDQRDRSSLMKDLVDHLPDGRIKLYLIWKLMTIIRDLPEVFRRGAYRPLLVKGEKERCVIAFLREHEEQTVLIAVPRFFTQLMSTAGKPLAWENTSVLLPPEHSQARWRNLWLDNEVDVGENLLLRDVSGLWPFVVMRKENHAS